MYKYYFSTYINSLREAYLKAVPSNRDFSSYHAFNINCASYRMYFDFVEHEAPCIMNWTLPRSHGMDT